MIDRGTGLRSEQWLEEPVRTEPALVGVDIGTAGDSLELLQATYRDPSAERGVRMRAAIAALPFERPKLAVTVTTSSEDLAARLEAMRRRRAAQPKLIEARAEPGAKAVTLAGAPFVRPRRGC